MDHERPTASVKWTVVRVAAGRDREVVLLSGDFVRLCTHWHKGSFLCTETPDCPACASLPARPYWYLPCLLLPSNAFALLELSAASSADLEQRAKMAGFGLRAGLKVRLERRSAKRPMRCEPVGFEASPRFAPLHAWLTGLMHIFGFTFAREGETLAEYGARISNAVLRRAELKAAAYEASCQRRVQGQGSR